VFGVAVSGAPLSDVAFSSGVPTNPSMLSSMCGVGNVLVSDQRGVGSSSVAALPPANVNVSNDQPLPDLHLSKLNPPTTTILDSTNLDTWSFLIRNYLETQKLDRFIESPLIPPGWEFAASIAKSMILRSRAL
jgi:hypothetical protein